MRSGQGIANSRVPLYQSTRGGATRVSFLQAVEKGLACDGGLYVPDFIPAVSKEEQNDWLHLLHDYREVCLRLMAKFIDPEEIAPSDLRHIVEASYKAFDPPNQCIGLKQMEIQLSASRGPQSVSFLELFHGPTLAFKDFALQFLGQVFAYIVGKDRAKKFVMLGATSGDTGSAAIAGFRGIENIRCAILFPENRTSHIQRLQMVTAGEKNVRCLQVREATFDDCQRLVKAYFSLAAKQPQGIHFAAVNSINWGRILAQIVYYWAASLQLRRDANASSDFKVDVCVPTGNFGNILAAYYAKRMGAPLNRLIIASNANNILTRIHQTGIHEPRIVVPTSSPSMDIQISSNFERCLYHMTSENSEVIKRLYSASGPSHFSIDEQLLKRLRDEFCAYCADEAEVSSAIRDVHRASGESYIIDPHTAVAVACVRKYVEEHSSSYPLLVVSTAHFGKFPGAVTRALGPSALSLDQPEVLSVLEGLPQRFEVIDPSLEQLSLSLEHFIGMPSECSV